MKVFKNNFDKSQTTILQHVKQQQKMKNNYIKHNRQ